MEKQIDIDNATITHLLGYLDYTQWASALHPSSGVDTSLIKKLITIQKDVFGADIMGEIEEDDIWRGVGDK